jgi:hypothetical protein
LILKASIYGQEYVEFRRFCLSEKFAVLKSYETGIPSALALMSREVMAQLFAYALVK